MSQYPISKEFFPFTYLKPPMNEPFLKLAALGMKTPKFLYQDYLLDVQRYEVKSYDQEEIEVFVISPKNCDDLLPCLLYFHGGGFVLKAASYHYQNAMTYAKECHCKVVFVNYRLAPKYPFPTFLKDGYAAMEWLYQNVNQLKIDKKRIGIGGDSAGASIAAGVCTMARDYHHPIQFSYQMLVYPFLDARNQSESCQKYKDTPMWNSSLSHKIAKLVKANKNHPLYHYYSILEASCF